MVHSGAIFWTLLSIHAMNIDQAIPDDVKTLSSLEDTIIPSPLVIKLKIPVVNVSKRDVISETDYSHGTEKNFDRSSSKSTSALVDEEPLQRMDEGRNKKVASEKRSKRDSRYYFFKNREEKRQILDRRKRDSSAEKISRSSSSKPTNKSVLKVKHDNKKSDKHPKDGNAIKNVSKNHKKSSNNRGAGGHNASKNTKKKPSGEPQAVSTTPKTTIRTESTTSAKIIASSTPTSTEKMSATVVPQEKIPSEKSKVSKRSALRSKMYRLKKGSGKGKRRKFQHEGNTKNSSNRHGSRARLAQKHWSVKHNMQRREAYQNERLSFGGNDEAPDDWRDGRFGDGVVYDTADFVGWNDPKDEFQVQTVKRQPIYDFDQDSDDVRRSEIVDEYLRLMFEENGYFADDPNDCQLLADALTQSFLTNPTGNGERSFVAPEIFLPPTVNGFSRFTSRQPQKCFYLQAPSYSPVNVGAQQFGTPIGNSKGRSYLLPSKLEQMFMGNERVLPTVSMILPPRDDLGSVTKYAPAVNTGMRYGPSANPIVFPAVQDYRREESSHYVPIKAHTSAGKNYLDPQRNWYPIGGANRAPSVQYAQGDSTRTNNDQQETHQPRIEIVNNPSRDWIQPAVDIVEPFVPIGSAQQDYQYRYPVPEMNLFDVANQISSAYNQQQKNWYQSPVDVVNQLPFGGSQQRSFYQSPIDVMNPLTIREPQQGELYQSPVDVANRYPSVTYVQGDSIENANDWQQIARQNSEPSFHVQEDSSMNVLRDGVRRNWPFGTVQESKGKLFFEQPMPGAFYPLESNGNAITRQDTEFPFGGKLPLERATFMPGTFYPLELKGNAVARQDTEFSFGGVSQNSPFGTLQETKGKLILEQPTLMPGTLYPLEFNGNSITQQDTIFPFRGVSQDSPLGTVQESNGEIFFEQPPLMPGNLNPWGSNGNLITRQDTKLPFAAMPFERGNNLYFPQDTLQLDENNYVLEQTALLQNRNYLNTPDSVYLLPIQDPEGGATVDDLTLENIFNSVQRGSKEPNRNNIGMPKTTFPHPSISPQSVENNGIAVPESSVFGSEKKSYWNPKDVRFSSAVETEPQFGRYASPDVATFKNLKSKSRPDSKRFRSNGQISEQTRRIKRVARRAVFAPAVDAIPDRFGVSRLPSEIIEQYRSKNKTSRATLATARAIIPTFPHRKTHGESKLLTSNGVGRRTFRGIQDDRDAREEDNVVSRTWDEADEEQHGRPADHRNVEIQFADHGSTRSGGDDVPESPIDDRRETDRRNRHGPMEGTDSGREDQDSAEENFFRYIGSPDGDSHESSVKFDDTVGGAVNDPSTNSTLIYPYERRKLVKKDAYQQNIQKAKDPEPLKNSKDDWMIPSTAADKEKGIFNKRGHQRMDWSRGSQSSNVAPPSNNPLRPVDTQLSMRNNEAWLKAKQATTPRFGTVGATKFGQTKTFPNQKATPAPTAPIKIVDYKQRPQQLKSSKFLYDAKPGMGGVKDMKNVIPQKSVITFAQYTAKTDNPVAKAQPQRKLLPSVSSSQIAGNYYHREGTNVAAKSSGSRKPQYSSGRRVADEDDSDCNNTLDKMNITYEWPLSPGPITCNLDYPVKTSFNTLEKEFEYVVSVQVRDDPAAEHEHICTGVLINPTHVLVAAHCTHGICSGCGLAVAYGIDLCLMTCAYKQTLNNMVYAKLVIEHENYKDSTRMNDIAIIQLETSMRLSCAKFPPTDIVGQLFASVGWGEIMWMNFQQNITKLQQKIPMARHEEKCEEPPGTIYVHTREIDLTGVIRGDFGGILISEECELMGIQSKKECGYEVYTRTRSYVTWIKNTMKMLKS